MDNSNSAAGSGSGSSTTTPDPREILATFLRENRILECLFCKKNKGVQGKETKVVSCYPQCGTTDTPEDIVGSNVNLMGFLRKCKVLDCHRCGQPMGFMHKTSEVFYCGPRCQAEHKKLSNVVSQPHGNTVSSPAPSTGQPSLVHLQPSAAVPSGTRGVEVKPEEIQFGRLTVVTVQKSSSSSANNVRPPLTTSSSTIATAPAPKPTQQQNQKKRGPGEPASTSLSTPLAPSKSPTPQGPKPKTQMQKHGETKSGTRTSTTKKRMERYSESKCCGKSFTERFQLKIHTYHNHMSVEQRKEERKKWTFRCQLCSQKFHCKSRLALHHRLIHKKKRMVKSCEMCGQICPNATELVEHLTSHMTPEQYKSKRYCPICSQQFKSRKSLQNHNTNLHIYE